MLKAWKQAWKKEALSSDQPRTTLNVDASMSRSSLKRPLSDPDDEKASTAIQLKRPKVDKHEEKVYAMLPDVLDNDETMDVREPGPNFGPSENCNESLLSHMRDTNTLIAVESDRQKSRTIEQFLQARRMDDCNKGSFTAILVVGSASIAKKRVSKLSALGATIVTGSPRLWNTILEKENVAVVQDNEFAAAVGSGDWELDETPLILDEISKSTDDEEPFSTVHIVSQAYWALSAGCRPRIVGFTRSLDGNNRFTVNMLNVEGLLDAKFFGIDDLTREALHSIQERPQELVLFYDPQTQSCDTPLLKGLRALDPQMSVFKSYFRNSRYALTNVGACGCELVWRRALKEIEALDKQQVYEEEDDADAKAASRAIGRNVAKYIRNWMFAMPNLDPSSRGFNVAPKFLKLIETLKSCEGQGQFFRGIVFVQKRSNALVMEELIRNLDGQLKFLRPRALVGRNSSSSQTMSEILDSFQAGIYNLLVATKFAEDLDIDRATTVIRYDLFDSDVSYAYCRARARGANCHLINMAERGNDIHRHLLNKFVLQNIKLEAWINGVGKSPNGSIPRFQLQETVDPYRSDSDDESDNSQPYIQDPTTSGRIYVRDATTAVYRLVSQLVAVCENQVPIIKPLFEFEALLDGSSVAMYSCTVVLPPNSPLQKLSGPPCSTKALARREACYQVCREFYNRGILDYRLFPRPSLPSHRSQKTNYISARMLDNPSDGEEDEIPISDRQKLSGSRLPGVHAYRRKRPDFWLHTLPVLRTCLYPTIVIPKIDSYECGKGYHAPLLILTRLPLPALSDMDLKFLHGSGNICFRRAEELEVDEEKVQDLYKYTVRLIRKISNKPFVCALDKMLYFFAPFCRGFNLDSCLRGNEARQSSFLQVANYIQWDSIKLAGSETCLPLKTQDVQSLKEDCEDALIQDRWTEFGRRYYAVRVRPDLSPLSKPADSAREQGHENLLEFVRARKKGVLDLQNEHQPLIEVDVCPSLANHLTTVERTSEGKFHPAKYLIPELCAKSPIPASVHRTALLLPSIMWRIDGYLLVKEINAKFFDHSIKEDELLAAITSPAANSGVDYERLELLGDAYLKYLSSIYLFVTFPTLTEGSLHYARQKIVSNRSLLRNAIRCDIPQYIQSRPLSVKAWGPPNFVVYNPPKPQAQEDATETAEIEAEEGEIPSGSKIQAETAGESKTSKSKNRKAIEENDEIQWFGDKAVSDVAEAIVGAAYVTGGREIALKVTKALNIPVPLVDKWSDFGRKALAPPPEATAKLRPGTIQSVEAIIGYRFSHPHLLAQALTHSSVHGSEMTSYERLEFIGDAILDFLVIRHIYDRDRNLSPGSLTLLKGAMVSNAVLAAICVHCGLHQHLLFESNYLDDDLQDYIDLINERQREADAQAARDGKAPAQYWVDVEPPKALSDVIESIIGAVYVSDMFSSVGAERFYDKILKPFYDRHITLEAIVHHPTKILFEMLQARGCQDFSLLREEIAPQSNEYGHLACCKVVIHDIILASATDHSMNSCARRAADMALDALAGDPSFMTGICKCKELNAAMRAARKAQKQAKQDRDTTN